MSTRIISTPRTGLHHRGELRHGRGDLLLYEHEDGPEGRPRLRPGADRADRRVRGRSGHGPRSCDHGGRAVPRGRRRRSRVPRPASFATPRARSRARLDTSDLPELLYKNLEHPRWDDVAERCLSCTNCTMVCPTCFCHSIEDVPDLDSQRSERVRLWDSCFNFDHAHTAGGNMRPDIRSRYRQWLTHKLASWIDQYGVSGCVGCGRCITWCPVAIDITEEVAAIRGGTTA